ncbi:cytochrome b [Luteimonas sp. SJ-92]|uniref:Cytochrome b n=1 Tax=Luteimonas salinisoli TaxID=2752307 RepID=A0A853JG04_9GAMM|nr:cytochrome b [Luteimonas salinisoli]NZA28311.1 cytochrome b [Luteimonas salinisoli]
MNWKNTADRWGGVSQLLHWLVVLLILGQGTVGLLMVDMLNSPDKIRIYALHKSFGLTILALVLLRLCWRLYAGAPLPVAGVPGWQRNAARLSHWLLYALLFAIPISGWLFNSAAGFPLQWFGLFNLPPIAGRDAGLRELAAGAHEWLFWLLLAVALVHAAAAFHHHLFLQDATLARMLPRGWLRAGDGHSTISKDSRDA